VESVDSTHPATVAGLFAPVVFALPDTVTLDLSQVEELLICVVPCDGATCGAATGATCFTSSQPENRHRERPKSPISHLVGVFILGNLKSKASKPPPAIDDMQQSAPRIIKLVASPVDTIC